MAWESQCLLGVSAARRRPCWGVGRTPMRCQGVKLPAGTGRRHLYLSAEQLDRLAGESGRYRGLVLLLGVGGLRWGEAAALRVRDIDALGRRVHLHENAVAVGGQ